MLLKSRGLVSAAVSVVALVAPSLVLRQASASTVTLYIQASPVTHNWVVFASDSSGDNAGLANYSITVSATGKLAITGGGQDVQPTDGASVFASRYDSGTFKVPSGLGKRGNKTLATGFSSIDLDGTLASGALAGISGAQNTAYGDTNNPTADSLVYQGVGQVDSTNLNPATGGYNVTANQDAPTDSLQTGAGAAWGSTAATGNSAAYAALIPFPQGTGPLLNNQVTTSAVDIASGTYSGASGSLIVNVSSASVGGHIITLNGTEPSSSSAGVPWTGPGNVSDAAVTSGSVTLVPEPATLGFLAFAGLGLMGRRRHPF